MPSFQFARADNDHAVVVGVGVVQAGAAAVIESTNFLTSEVGATGFILPAAWPQGTPLVVRVGNVAATIYPAVGATIDGAAINAVRSVTAGKSAIFWSVSDGTVLTSWLCVVSA